MPAKPEVTGFFDPRTSSIQYVVADPETGKCAVIDPVLDYDEKSGATATIHADEILRFIADKGYAVEWILDTHPHADHFSAAAYLKERTGAPTAIGGVGRGGAGGVACARVEVATRGADSAATSTESEARTSRARPWATVRTRLAGRDMTQ